MKLTKEQSKGENSSCTNVGVIGDKEEISKRNDYKDEENTSSHEKLLSLAFLFCTFHSLCEVLPNMRTANTTNYLYK